MYFYIWSKFLTVQDFNIIINLEKFTSNWQNECIKSERGQDAFIGYLMSKINIIEEDKFSDVNR